MMSGQKDTWHLAKIKFVYWAAYGFLGFSEFPVLRSGRTCRITFQIVFNSLPVLGMLY